MGLQKLFTPLLHAKLRTKMLLSFTFVILIALIMVSAISYSVSVKSLKTSTTNYSHYILQQIGKSLDGKAQELEEQMFTRYLNAGIGSVLLASATSGDPDKQMQNRLQIGNFLYSLVYTINGVEFVYLYDANGESYSQIKNNLVQSQLYIPPEPLVNLPNLKEHRGQALWVAQDERLIYMQRALYDVNTTEFCGYIVIGINSRYLKGEYAQFEALQYGRVFVLNEQDDLLLYRSEDKLQGSVDKLAGIADKQQIEILDERYIASVNISSLKGWKLINVVSLQDITAPADLIRLWILAAFLLSFIAAMVLTIVISSNITSNLRLFVRSMKNVSEGFFDKIQPPRSRDEIGMLAEKFNLMSDKIKDLVDKIYEEQAQKQMAEYRTLQFEYKALQAQINPHFLYNTLESIQSLAILKDEKEIGRMIFLLGSLFQDTVRNTSDFVTLDEEIAYIRKYLELEQMVYDDKLAVHYDLDESLLERKVPKFILQPIVENAILHGIEKKPGKGLIEIRCQEEDGTIVLEVKDTGIGISPERVDKLMQTDGEEAAPTRVGVRSVHKRVRILYGTDYGLTIASEPGHGTTIRIILPVRESEEDKLSNKTIDF